MTVDATNITKGVSIQQDKITDVLLMTFFFSSSSSSVYYYYY